MSTFPQRIGINTVEAIQMRERPPISVLWMKLDDMQKKMRRVVHSGDPLRPEFFVENRNDTPEHMARIMEALKKARRVTINTLHESAGHFVKGGKFRL